MSRLGPGQGRECPSCKGPERPMGPDICPDGVRLREWERPGKLSPNFLLREISILWRVSIDIITLCLQHLIIVVIVIFYFFFFCLFRATPMAYGVSQARGLMGAVGPRPHHSHSKAGSNPCLRPTPQLMAMPILNPLSEARN